MPTKSTKKGKTRLDKYYYLAKEQGYRSRAAFKLVQLNKKFNFLSNAKVLLDLCAAPGGWLQVASKAMPLSSIIIGLDLVPIRAIKNVTTFDERQGGDITSKKCRAVLKTQLNGWKADVVLHDGAPNVGGAWSKDAYGQNELVLHSLKLATEFLKEDGTFVTKVFRSTDYNSLIWIFKQLFGKVTATKPQSSRNTSAEIFVVCEDYLAPDKIDPKMLDPAYVFTQVAEIQKKVDIFHKKTSGKVRNRGGYDTALGVGLHRSCTVSEFLTRADPTTMLSNYQAVQVDDAISASGIMEHKHTTPEVVACLGDLQVLGQKDFKLLLKWRIRMNKFLKKDVIPAEAEDVESEEEDAATREDKYLLDFVERKEKRKRRDIKRARKEKAVQRKRLALGMTESSVDVTEKGVFSLDTLNKASAERISAVRSGDLSKHPQLESDEEEFPQGRPPSLRNAVKPEQGPDSTTYLTEMENEFEAAFESRQSKQKERQRILANGPTGLAGGGKKGRRKRETKQLQDLFDKEVGEGDAAPADADSDSDGHDSSDDAADEAEARALTAAARRRARAAAKRQSRHSNDNTAKQIADDDDDDDDMEEEEEPVTDVRMEKANRFFSASIFQEIKDETAAALAAIPLSSRQQRKEKLRKLAVREEKRTERRNKDENRVAKAAFEIVADYDDDDEQGEEVVQAPPKNAREAKLEAKETKAEIRRLEAERLIKAGMGIALQNGYNLDEAAAEVADEAGETREPTRRVGADGKKIKVGQFEVVPAQTAESSRKSLEELEDVETGTFQHAQLLAMGQLMFSHSKAKAMIDNSYNKHTWPEEEDLPSWFAQDEKYHNRPQLPVTKEMISRIRQRFQDIADKPIKKVAEARARKKKRAVEQMTKAKKKAQAILDQEDLSNFSKMKAVRKAYAGTTIARPSKTYVVGTTKGEKGGRSSFGVKFVDKRMKSDKRGLKKAEGSRKKRNKSSKTRQSKRRKRR